MKYKSTLIVGASLLLLFLGFSFFALSTALLKGNQVALVQIRKGDQSEVVFQRLAALPHTNTLALCYFKALCYISNAATHPREGIYDLGSGQSALWVFRSLKNGRLYEKQVHIPQLRTKEELAAYLDKNLHVKEGTPSFSDYMVSEQFLKNFDKNPETALCLILPNTHRMYYYTTAENVLKKLALHTQKFWTPQRKAQAQAQGLTPDQAYVLASIVEKETNYEPEKARVAGMYLNRLRQNMPLQADPTVVFAVGDFSIRRIQGKHLRTPSPYNTYLNKGLPPGPIGMPSKASIEAVLWAEQHDYIYMCAKEDFSGHHNFAVTYEEHLRNAAKYRKALDERGIQ